MKAQNLDHELETILQNFEELHPADIAGELKQINKKDKEKFYAILHKIPEEFLGDVLLELPESLRDKAYKSLSSGEISQALKTLETDDATDIIQDIEEIDQQKASAVLNSLDQDDQDDINWLKKYDEDVAGAYMQIELFSANQNETIQDSINRLKMQKEKNKLENVHQVFVTDDNSTLLAALSLEDLLTYDFDITYKEILLLDIENNYKPLSVKAEDDIENVVKLFESYNLSVVAVTGYKNRLLGRITSDDILDVVEQSATEQMYQLAGVDDEFEQEEELLQTSKKRASWLFINLLTAILASIVIGVFDETLKQYIALAILMPIVASMGGNAGTQTLAVMVRQLALGDINEQNGKDAVKKEILIALLNGCLFAVLLGGIAAFWFNNIILGFVIALSMVITLFSAGFFGAVIPLALKKVDIDPAIGSTVLLTTVTDIMGFFSFLALATYFLV
ncbi:magnesium transporter [Arcobacter sp. 15-2]|uniref:magnesium transporter n=1 Tax=Arcobacter sp. 15-2 TaxID=3374109 RepID=UPI00399CA0E6